MLPQRYFLVSEVAYGAFLGIFVSDLKVLLSSGRGGRTPHPPKYTPDVENRKNYIITLCMDLNYMTVRIIGQLCNTLVKTIHAAC